MKTELRKFRTGIIFLLLSVMLAGLLMACRAESSYEPLSDEKKLEIEQAWSSQRGYPLYWYTKETGWGGTRYYGTHEDCVALFHPAQTTAEKTIEVDGYEFTHSSGFNIYIYRDGEFLKIEDAYEKGWLAKSQVASIAEYHRSWRQNNT